MKQSGGAIPYRPELRAVCGSVTATILFQQLEYWFDNQGGEFYKFLAPCHGHKHYKPGDSWQEELGFSDDEFRAAFDRIGKRYRSKKEFNDDQDGRGKFMFVSYTDKRSGLTHYVRNAEVIKTTLANQIYCKSESPSYSKPTNPIPRDGKTQDREVDNSDTGRSENPIPKILAETTSEITKDYTEKTTRTVDNPLNKPRLKSNASALCTEAMDAFNSQILKRKAQPDYTMWPAWVALAGDEQAAFETVMGIIYASKIPDGPRLPFQLDGVFRDPARAAYWRAQYKPTKSEHEWLESGDQERIISTVARILKNNGTVPKEAESWIPQAQQRLTKHLVA